MKGRIASTFSGEKVGSTMPLVVSPKVRRAAKKKENERHGTD